MRRPLLSGARLRLRPATADDFEPLAALLRAPPVRRYLCDDRLLDDAEVRAILATSDADDARNLGMWVLTLPEEPFAGVVQLMDVNADMARGTAVAGMVEPVVALQPRHFGRGLATEALALCAAHARDAAGLTALAGVADAPNVASRRMLARAGYVAVGETPGRAHPLILHRLALAPAGFP